MKPKLSICIPTHNRARYLRECLNSVLPQAIICGNVEVIVIDNASEDNTRQVVSEFLQQLCAECRLKYYRNEKNMGYTGNQINCIKYATGQYMAFLCDDDAYTKGTIAEILNVIDNNVEYAFIALNYYSFLDKIDKPYKTNYAPNRDVLFKRAYDIMNYPSVGHYSGFIFNTKIAKESLAQLINVKTFETYERYRGIITDVAIRSVSSSSLPAYFIGKKVLAARIPKTVDYDSLYHQCIDYYEYYNNLHSQSLINNKDLEYRAMLVLGRLPRAIIADGWEIGTDDLDKVTRQLTEWFKGNDKFDWICLPLLRVVKYRFIKIFFHLMTNIVRYSKSIRYNLAS